DNLVPELAKLNQLLAEHSCFFEGAKVRRLSLNTSPIYALQRESEDGQAIVLVLVNTDIERTRTITLDVSNLKSQISNPGIAANSKPEISDWVDLLGQKPPELAAAGIASLSFTLAPG